MKDKEETTPYAPFQVRNVKLRADASGSEPGADSKPHPWLALGRLAAWNDGLLLAVLETHAIKRRFDKRRNGFLRQIDCVDGNGAPYRTVAAETKKLEDSYVDIQNLWTFSRDHFDNGTDWTVGPSLQDIRQRAAILSDITSHTQWRDRGVSDDWLHGSVVAITLSLAHGGAAAPSNADTVVAALLAAGIAIPPDWAAGGNVLLPGVILATDRVAREERGQDPWPFVTVVPAVPVPESDVRKTDVCIRDDSGRVCVVLTACLLTLDHSADNVARTVEIRHPSFRTRLSEFAFSRIRARSLAALSGAAAVGA